jgi:drug/metabolite transporter (DMT)-like permease
MSRSNTANRYLALGCGIAAVSTGAIFARMADAPPLVIAAYRVGLASLVLIPLALWKSRAELFSLARQDLILAVTAGFFLALHFATWISSLEFTSVANSVVLVNTNPLWVGLLTPLIAGEKIQRPVAISIVLSVIGGVLIGWGDFAKGGSAIYGDLLALAGSWGAAAYLLLGRKLRRKLSLLAYITVCYGAAAVCLWSAVLVLGLRITGYSSQTVMLFWAMALFTQLVGHTSFNWALKWLSAGAIAVSLLGEPIGSTLLAYILFDEGLTGFKVAGGAFILCAIYMATVSENRKDVDV